jgi:succinyl-CoA synthetase alpha subunit
MPVFVRVKPSEYHDSITLMQAAAALLEMPGVADAAVIMGTGANHEIVAAAGMLTDAVRATRPDDLVIIVVATDEVAGHAALAKAEEVLSRRAEREEQASFRAKSLASAVAAHPDANLAVVSVAGRYAAAEARAALEQGLHVLLFSDNVPLEDEIALKKLAVSKNLLCMGPDAGTAIINGVALGFANAVPRGKVGLVSAAGTGLQGVTTGIARRGAGVSQAIGTGGRDLSEPVGGMTMLQGLRMLQEDPETEIIVLISKPPAQTIAQRVLAAIDRTKPTVVCFLGADPGAIERAGALPATTLTQAAVIAAALAKGNPPDATYCHKLVELEEDTTQLITLALAERAKLAPGQAGLRGLYAGGTFCYEAQLLLKNLPEPVYSNAPLNKETGFLAETGLRPLHTVIDLGEDEFTQGRLHPMIDPSLRNRRIVQEARDPSAAVILLDFVLGYGAHVDPAGASLDALREARADARAAGRHIIIIASVCGTEQDPQRLSEQEAKLRAAGVLVLPDNASAARLAGLITQGGDLLRG